MTLRKWIYVALLRLEILPFVFVSRAGDFVIVTGADSSHYRSLLQFLGSAFRYEPQTRIVVFDLGFTEAETQELLKTYPLIDLRVFDYSNYPEYFNVKVNAGEYAWKPVIVADMLAEFKCCVCWMDAGNVITKPLSFIRKIVHSMGMYSPSTPGTISEWTHPGTLEFLKVPSRLLQKHNLSTACVAVSFSNKKAMTLIERWREYALIRECIAPKGSSRKNHRQEQAVLSVLAHMSGITKGMPIRKYGFKWQQDID